MFYHLKWPDHETPTLLSHFSAYDGSYYLTLCKNGYQGGAQTSAFYPLWPLTIKLTSFLCGGNYLVVGLILANILSILAWVLFYSIVEKRWGNGTAKGAVVFLIAFPGSFFYQFLYSESLFFLLIMGLWWGLENKRYGLAFIFAYLLPLSRPIGVFCFLPILWHVLTVCPPIWLERRPRLFALLTRSPVVPEGQGEDTQKSQGTPLLKSKDTLKSFRWWLVLTPFFGWLFYFTLMFIWTNNPLDGFAAQRFWGVHSISNLWNVPKFFHAWFSPKTWHGYDGSFLDETLFTLVVCSVPILWKLDKSLLAWLYVLAILPAMSGMFVSSTRYSSVAFPIFIAISFFFKPASRRWCKFGLMGAFVILQSILIWRYVNYQWAN
jgi:hypothetical protein